MKQAVLIIGGPTASGKSGLAASVAEAFGGTVINADSMQVYNGLPILTAQPSPADTARVPHRLYATLSPAEACSAARWRERALAEIRAAQAAERLPVIVGGTGFYIKALLEGMSPIPDIPPRFRDEAAALQKELGNPGFYQELARRDPLMVAKLDPFNTQRLVRAFEVLLATGKSLAEWQSAPRIGPPEDLRFLTITLQPRRETLYAACDARFGHMLESGALEEVRDFSRLAPPNTALAKALGYLELLAHLEGKITLAEAIALAQQSTRNYAKRQTTWFRHQIRPDLVLEGANPGPLIAHLKKCL